MKNVLFCLCFAALALSACSTQNALSPSISYEMADLAVPSLSKGDHFVAMPENPTKFSQQEPVSTFSIDVDTGSYSLVRRMLSLGKIPDPDAVRVEELINYFSYDYPVPKSPDRPFSVTTEIGPNPWNTDTLLLQIGIKGYEPDVTLVAGANLVFLVDVSGSMQGPDRLDLVKRALAALTGKLSARDQISLVVYAGAAGVVLPPTAGNDKTAIIAALNRLEAGGTTHGSAGIQLAYDLAQQAFIPGGANRIILCTDGDLNVGITDTDDLKRLVEQERRKGVSLTTLGFGEGNYNDHLLEQLADVGNGNYAYIDNFNEARKVLVDHMHATLMTIAKDVKIQIEFDPATVSQYRLIGYENRVLNRTDFNNDRVDAGEIGAGHAVTAIYEIRLANHTRQGVDPLRYQANTDQTSIRPDPNTIQNQEFAYLKLRYKQPQGSLSELVGQPLLVKDIQSTWDQTSDNFRFASSVAAFGQKLRGSNEMGLGFSAIKKLAENSLGHDQYGYRREFVSLLDSAETLTGM